MIAPRKSIFASAKKSVGGFGQTPLGKRASVHPSSVTSSAGRRASVGGARTTGEDRPIAEPSYQRQCIESLNEFLIENGHPPVNPKFVTCPSSNDIKRVFEILLAFWEISIDSLCPPGRPWDSEIGNVVRTLGYRYPVAKKNLAVNSTTNNARGQLFGLIDWLVNGTRVRMRAEAENLVQAVPELHIIEVAISRDKLEDHIPLLVEQDFPDQLDELTQQQHVSLQRVKRVEEECDRFKETDAVINGFKKEVFEFTEYANSYESRLLQFREHTSSERSELTSRQSSLDEEIEMISREQEQIDARASSQEMNAVEVHEILESLDQKMLGAKQEADKNRDILRTAQRELETVQDDLSFHLKNGASEFTKLDTFLSPLPQAEPIVSSFNTRQYKDLAQLLQSQDWSQFKDDSHLSIINFASTLNTLTVHQLSSIENHAITSKSSHDKILIEHAKMDQKLSLINADLELVDESKAHLTQELLEKRELLQHRLKKSNTDVMRLRETLRSRSSLTAEKKAAIDQEVADYDRALVVRTRKIAAEFRQNCKDAAHNARQQLVETQEVRSKLQEVSLKLQEKHNHCRRKNKKVHKALDIVAERRAKKEDTGDAENDPPSPS